MPGWVQIAWFLAAILLGGSRANAEIAPELLREVFPGAERAGPMEGNPPAATVFGSDGAIGYVFFTYSVIGSLGYSGKPIDLAVGLTRDGRIAGARLVRHQEPILVLGIDEAALHRYVAGHRGLPIQTELRVTSKEPAVGQPDTIAGATVTSLLLREAILRSARAVARSRGLAGSGGSLDLDRFEPQDWAALQADGALAQLRLIGADIARRLGPDGAPAADVLFIDLYTALLTPAGIGRNLLGDGPYNGLVADLADGDQAILVAANGLYSFKGTSFARSGRFDRIRIVQGESTFVPEASRHRRLARLAAEMPEFREIGVFILPAASGFEPAAPWRLELLVDGPDSQRPPAIFGVEYRLPTGFLRAVDPASKDIAPALWQDLWWARSGRIAICVLALLALTSVLVLQERLAKQPILYRRLRIGFLVFTIAWLGWYASAQLSVVNVLTFAHALLTGFRWDFFLLEPLVFLLWSFTAVALLFWGRGVFCGWLCPFGALQDLAYRLGRWLRLPAIRLSFVVHERLAALKYVFFLVIFALSLNFTEQALAVAEIEPFKTAIALRFMRPWPFVLYVLALLASGLVLERMFCRYLCPLGAGLAIPARLRLFEWLKRKKQCGTECQVCASRCPVQAIHPDGRINPNECVYCLNCQLLYYDANTCPPLIARRQRREARGTPRPPQQTVPAP